MHVVARGSSDTMGSKVFLKSYLNFYKIFKLIK